MNNRNWKNIGLAAIAAGALAYPAYRLYKYLLSKKDELNDELEKGKDEATHKIAHIIHSRQKVHGRHAHNGHLHDGHLG